MDKTICSFCGKSQAQVRRLVSSPSSGCYICDSCIEVCREIIEDAENKNKKPHKFSLPTPQEIKDILDMYIVEQENAKKIMSVAVYNHYKRVNYNLSPNNKIELDKSNILLIGPTGVGKTLIAKTLANILKVPFVCADATSLTEAGYVGDDVESILSKLLINADYDVKKAEMGIIYIDEIDKIAKKIDTRNMTRDVSGEGVQQGLLKILEGTEAQVTINGSRKTPHQDTITMNTSNILFICGGAFVKLDEIIKNRMNSGNLGFNIKKEKNNSTKDVIIDDLINFGLIPEFVGRLPIIISLNPLNKEAMLNILSTPKNNLLEQYKTLFKLDGVEIEFAKDLLDDIADRAIKLGMGARGLRTILEEKMLDSMFCVPTKKDILKLIFNKDSISTIYNKEAKKSQKINKN